jgi:DNA mismatch repair ATPase MutS
MNRIIDKNSYHILELKSIVSTINPLSEPGRKLKAVVLPYKSDQGAEVRKEYALIGEFITYCRSEHADVEGIKLWLSHVKDLSGTAENCCRQTLELFEMQELKTFALASLKLAGILKGSHLCPPELPRMIDLYHYLDPEQTETTSFQLYDEYSPKLKEIRSKLGELTRKRKLSQQAKLHAARQTLNLTKCEPEIIISRTNQEMIARVEESGMFHRTKENFANIIFGLKEDEHDLLFAEHTASLLQELKIIEKNVREEITGHLKEEYQNSIKEAIRAIAHLDLRFVKALYAIKNKCVIPHLTDNRKLVISQAVNMPIKSELLKNGMTYQPVDIELEEQLNILIGANMAGKTSVLKTVGQFAYLTAYAIPLPCTYAELPLFDFIFFSGFDPQLQSENLSSFAYNIVELQNHKTNPEKGLFLIDEFARGTNPQEGEALCRAMLESFLKTEHFVFASTHFTAPAMIPEAAHFSIPGLTEELFRTIESEQILDIELRITKMNSIQKFALVKVDVNKIPPRTALMIAELLGVEKDVIEKAKSYLN